MPRPTTRGLEYTYLAKDFFYDRKVKRLKRKCGDDAPYVFLALLCLIAPEGYYIKYDNDTVYDLADMTGFDEEKVAEILDTCGEVGLLDEEMMETEHILTSHGIQKYYATTSAQLKRKTGVEEFSLLNRTNGRVSSEETPRNSQNEEFPPKNEEEIPTKGKEGIIGDYKENNSKEDSFSSSSSPSSEVAPSEAEKQEEKFIAYMFFQNWAAPGKEYRKFVAFNNTGGRCWAKMDKTQREAALVLWKQEPLQPKRFLNQHLAGWRRIYHLLVQLGAPYLLRIHALSDNIAIERENGNTTIRCPTDVMRFIEENRDAGFRAAIQEYFFSGKEITNLKFAECPP